MANTIATSNWVLKEVALGYTNNVTFVKNMDKTLSDQYVQSGAKVGNTVNVRLPYRTQTSSGEAIAIQPLLDVTVPVTIDRQIQWAGSWSSAQATTELDSIRKRYVEPASTAIANAADQMAFLNCYSAVYQAIGTPGAGAPSTFLDYLNAGVKLDDASVPMDGRVAVLDSYQMAVLVNASTTMFNPSAAISENYRKGMFGRGQLGIEEWFKDSNRPVHTTGTFTASTPVVNGANQTGSTLATNGWASGASSLKKGDIFTIAGVNSVNQVSYQDNGRLQQFVVTADTSDSAGAMATLPISPSIITSGALQTVTGSPANGAAITVLGATAAVSGTLATTTSAQGMIFIPEAFSWVSADLERITAGASSERVRSKEWGISLRLVEQYQIGTDQNPCRIDLLCGATATQPRMAVRIFS